MKYLSYKAKQGAYRSWHDFYFANEVIDGLFRQLNGNSFIGMKKGDYEKFAMHFLDIAVEDGFRVNFSQYDYQVLHFVERPHIICLSYIQDILLPYPLEVFLREKREGTKDELYHCFEPLSTEGRI